MVSRPPLDEADLGIAPAFEAEKSVPPSDTLSSAVPMSNGFLGLQLWFAFSLVLIGVVVFAAFNARPSYALTVFGDLTQLFLVASAAGVMFANGLSRPGLVRGIWLLLSLGFSVWLYSLFVCASFSAC